VLCKIVLENSFFLTKIWVQIEKEYCKENWIDRSVIEPTIIDFCDDDSDDDAG
jgi:hypothetical protein